MKTYNPGQSILLDNNPNRNGMGRILSDWRLWIIICLAFFLRCVWLFSYTQVIENEGAVYARLAENLVEGKGYIWTSGGRHTLFPPLYPILIGAVSYATGNTETAGRLISLLMGTLLPLSIFLLTGMVFGRRGALVAAALVAVHPMFIALSGSVYSESLYFTIWIFGIYFALQTLRGNVLRHAVLAGLFFGIAYLVRPEAIAYSFLTAIWVLMSAVLQRLEIRNALLRAAAATLVTAVVATPYVVWLSANSGYIRLEGKSVINNIHSKRMIQGMNYQEAGYGLGPNGEVEGPYLFENQFDIVRDDTSDTKALISFVFRDLGYRGLKLGWNVVRTRTIGSPILVILAVIGFLIVGYSHRRVFEEGFLALVVVAYLVMLLSLRWWWNRFLFPLALIITPWAGAGVSQITRWIQERADVPAGNKSLRSRLAAAMAACIIFASMIIPSVIAVLGDATFNITRFTALREAGQWLYAQEGGNKSYMGNSAVFAYYAHGTRMYLPYASESVTLEYIHRKNPDFIVLREDDRNKRPYIGKWLQSGIPDKCASEIKRIRQVDSLGLQSHHEELIIYKWLCPSGATE